MTAIFLISKNIALVIKKLQFVVVFGAEKQVFMISDVMKLNMVF